MHNKHCKFIAADVAVRMITIFFLLTFTQMYFVRIPPLIQKLYSSVMWRIPNGDKKVYLTFDDGPHPEITPWVLEQLKKHGARATFFCLGKNAERFPEIVNMIREQGHALGSHGYAHLNGWKTEDKIYEDDFKKADSLLSSKLFRPSYGKIKRSQISYLKSITTIVNWTLMPGDFDKSVSSEQCYNNFVRAQSGDIICLHDNEKAWKHLQYILPKFLEEHKEFIFDKIDNQ